MNKTDEKPHLSPTQIGMYGRCPEQYRRRYLEQDIIPPGIAAHVGTGLHRGAELNFALKIETRVDMPRADIIDAAVAGFEQGVRGTGVVYTDEEVSRGIKNVVGEATDQVVAVAGLFADEAAPEYQPTEVERSTRIVIPGAPYDLLGITDLRDEEKRVVDFKTAGRRKSVNEAERSLQLTVYCAAYLVDHQEPPSEVRLDVITTGKKPVRQVLSSNRTQRDFVALRKRIEAVASAIQGGAFPPCDPGAWCCSPKWCGYWNSCPYVNSQRRAAAKEGV
jgi:hypothetical protein